MASTLINRQVRRELEVDLDDGSMQTEVLIGTIVSYSHHTTYYEVDYHDGGEPEEFTHEELLEMLIPTQEAPDPGPPPGVPGPTDRAAGADPPPDPAAPEQIEEGSQPPPQHPRSRRPPYRRSRPRCTRRIKRDTIILLGTRRNPFSAADSASARGDIQPPPQHPRSRRPPYRRSRPRCTRRIKRDTIILLGTRRNPFSAADSASARGDKPPRHRPKPPYPLRSPLWSRIAPSIFPDEGPTNKSLPLLPPLRPPRRASPPRSA
mmetsp:Transcript_34286/g.65501  ORF Transcript_34286/g.65501 Transcript_34286/m.65501 type:complete len:263 (-) Transcript_34286:1584-2372(-)